MHFKFGIFQNQYNVLPTVSQIPYLTGSYKILPLYFEITTVVELFVLYANGTKLHYDGNVVDNH